MISSLNRFHIHDNPQIKQANNRRLLWKLVWGLSVIWNLLEREERSMSLIFIIRIHWLFFHLGASFSLFSFLLRPWNERDQWLMMKAPSGSLFLSFKWSDRLRKIKKSPTIKKEWKEPEDGAWGSTFLSFPLCAYALSFSWKWRSEAISPWLRSKIDRFLDDRLQEKESKRISGLSFSILWSCRASFCLLFSSICPTARSKTFNFFSCLGVFLFLFY